MGRDVLRRVRWGNVALAAAVVAALVAVVAWPRLTAPAPALPGDAAQPLVRGEDRRGERGRGESPPKPRARPRGARGHGRARSARRRKHTPKRRAATRKPAPKRKAPPRKHAPKRKAPTRKHARKPHRPAGHAPPTARPPAPRIIVTAPTPAPPGAGREFGFER